MYQENAVLLCDLFSSRIVMSPGCSMWWSVHCIHCNAENCKTCKS